MERAGEYYTCLKEVSAATDGSAMVSHRMVSEDVYETTWENGCRVLVNYRETDVTVGDVVIQAHNYRVLM